MSSLPFAPLPAFAPRRFLSAEARLGDWPSIEEALNRLETAAVQCRHPAELERWLLDWGELKAALDEEGSRRYIAMTCHTEDPQAEALYLSYVQEIDPRFKPRQFRLEQLYLNHPLRRQLDQVRYGIFDRNTHAHAELFRPENVPLEAEEARRAQSYQKRCGSLTVFFQGAERTLPQMAVFLEESNRVVRQEAWELAAQRRYRESEAFDDLFDELFQTRHQIALQAGFANYRDYAFCARGRFDYTPAQCHEFHACVEDEVVPLLRKIHQHRRSQLGLDCLRPWDLSVDLRCLPPLRPFSEPSQLELGVHRIFERLDSALASDFSLLRSLRLLDLENRPGKAPGGYQCTLAEARVPFIFMNAVGLQRDVETLLHEAGHAFHMLAARQEPFFPYREAPIEFCEVASMSMELLGNDYLEVFYAAEEARRARRRHFEGIIEMLPWIAAVDAFQHWLYTHPGHDRRERSAAWTGLMRRFGGEVNWSGYEAIQEHWWHRQLHIFIHPFYYVEYGIAQLGALQVWANSRIDKTGALCAYKEALALGGSRPLPDLFRACGCRFDFGRQTIAPLMTLVRNELETVDMYSR